MKEIKQHKIDVNFKEIITISKNRRIFLNYDYMNGDADTYDEFTVVIKNTFCDNIEDFVINEEIQKEIDIIFFLNYYIKKCNENIITMKDASDEILKEYGEELCDRFDESPMDTIHFNSLAEICNLVLEVYDAEGRRYKSSINLNNY